MSAPSEIIVFSNDVEISRHALAPGEHTIGRASAASIPITLGPVSREHARLRVSESGAVQVEDLTSANGTLLDEIAVSDLTLWTPKQTLRIGDVTLRAS